MRWILSLLCLTTLAAAQEPALDDARVQLSYKELKTLIEAAKVKPPEVSPVESSILSAHYDVQWRESTAAGVASFEVQTFRDGPLVVPLAGDGLIIESVEPKDTTVVLRDGHYALAVEGKQKIKVTLRFTLPARQTEESLAVECTISPAVTASVQIRDIPKDRQISVDNALRVEATEGVEKWQLGRSALLRIELRDEPKPLPPPIVMPAVIGEATSDMRVVADGAFSNRMTWRIRHQAPLVWRLDLAETNQLVSSQVGEQPASPSRVDAKTIEFRLPEPAKGETVVELSYTGKGKAFDPVRGELALTLPATPLLVESLTWRVAMPAIYETVAAQGNVDFLPGNSAGDIRLSKELCQGDAPAVRLFYQKPETTKKP